MKISCVIPCLDESGNIETMFLRISRALSGIDFEVVFIDDGSSDSTRIEISSLTQKFPQEVRLVVHEENRGIHKSWISGVSAANGDLVCLIDGDLQNPPEAILDLIAAYETEGADFIQGTRSSIGRDKDGRLVLSRALNGLLNFIFRTRSKDSKSGFVLASKNVMLDVISVKRKYIYFQTFIGVSAAKKGYKIVEVETLFAPRNVGKSFVFGYRAYLAVFKVLLDFPNAILEFNFQKKILKLASVPTSYKIKLSIVRRLHFEFYFATAFAHKWIISRHVKQKYLWLKSTEFLSRQQIENIQLVRLQTLLRFANQHVPYYKTKFNQEGFDPRAFGDMRKLSDLPLLSKNDVRENIHFRMFSHHHNKKQMQRIKTSGSTGEPFVCYADKFQLEMRFASTLRAYEMAGWNFGDKQMRLWHQTIGMSRSQVFRERVDAFLMRRKFVPAYELTAEKVEKLLKYIEKSKPRIIDGYAESLNFLAMFVKDKSKWTPNAIISSAQELTDSTRAAIEQTFSTNVLDKYGSREFSGIAYQCEYGKNYHVQDESYIVELLIDGRAALPGEIGEVVITDLNNYSTPMIRYRIGDLAQAVEQTDCPCRRKHFQIGKISGRTQALVYCSNGVWLPGTFFAHFFKEFDYAVRHYQVHQDNEFGFNLRIVPNEQYSEIIGKKIVSDLRSYTGKETQINLEILETIPLLITGKRTPVISNLKVDFQKIGKSLLVG
jgi:phenylacetate-CoA ligase